MIDWVRVAELRDEVGDEDYAEVVEIFLEEVDEIVSRLRQEPDLSRLEADLHFLKGSCLNLGFQAMGDFCAEGEVKSSNGRQQEVEIKRLFELYAASREGLFAGIG